MGSRAASPSLFERTIGHPRPARASLAIVVLIFAPSLAAGVQLGLADVLARPDLRSLLAPATILAYLVLIAPILATGERNAVAALRPIIQADEVEVDRLIERGAASLVQELAGIAGGLALGALIFGDASRTFDSWASFIVDATLYAMMGVFGWTAAYSIASTRFANSLMQQPLRVDPLDIRPFEGIGRQSLVLAMAFIGVIALGLLLARYGEAAFLELRFWLLYLPVIAVPITVFFLRVQSTHRVLADAKAGELGEVRRELHNAFRRLLLQQRTGQEAGDLATVVAGLADYEQALAESRTWPYDITTIRTLVLSIFVPLMTILLRRVLEVYIG
jgi:hypothetical protein